MQINLEYFRTFYYACKHMNYTAAAEELCVTQTTVTKAIQKMEEQLGCKLFTRVWRGIALTPEGQALYDQVRLACEQLFAAEQNMERIKNLESGVVHIGATETTFQRGLVPTITDFKKQYPHIQVEIDLDTVQELHRRLESGRLDFTVHSARYLQDPKFNYDPLYVSQNIPVVGRSLAFLSERELSFEELSQYPWLAMRSGYLGRELCEKMFADSGISLQPSIELASTHMLVSMTELGLGFSYVPEPFIHSNIANGTLFPLRLPLLPPSQEIYLVTMKNRAQSLATQAFLKMLRGHFSGSG